MIGSNRIALRIWKLFSNVLLAALACSAIAPANAAIVLTGNVIPSPAVGDPWDVGGSLTVGENASGTMTVNAGSDVNSTDGFVANLAGSTGTVTVNGAGSTWNNSGELRMGNFGTGTLNITGGGAVTVTGNGRIGNSPGGIGMATVDGAGSTLSSDIYILVGREGNGSLNIKNSGVVSDAIGGIAIFEGSSGAVTINGSGSAWNNLNELQIADGGTATLDILNGGVATSPKGYLGVSADGVGTVSVSGSGSAWNNSEQLQVGYVGHGTINIQSGGTVSSALGYVGVLSNSTGTVTVSDNGSTWTNSSELFVGYEGSGTLNIYSGAAVSASAGFVGNLAGSTGTATVDGAGSTWTNSGTLTVGNLGTGNLHVHHGGLVSAAALDGVGGVNFDGGTLRITASDMAGNALTLEAGGGTLDVATAATTVTISSDIGGSGGLSKTGAGTLELMGTNTYVGDTRIEAGKINTSQAVLNDLSDVFMAAGASFGLNFSGEDVIDSLFIDGTPMAPGTYGASFPTGIFTGTGRLRVTRTGVLGDYNDNGTVDAADYTVWRNRLHSAAALANDNTPGVGNDDYARWKANYGQLVGGGLGATANIAVPEPAALMLFASGVLAICAAGLTEPTRFLPVREGRPR